MICTADSRATVHQDGAHSVHSGLLQVRARPRQLMATALEVLLVKDGQLGEIRGKERERKKNEKH